VFEIGGDKLVLYRVAEIVDSLHNTLSPISVKPETFDEERLFKHYD